MKSIIIVSRKLFELCIYPKAEILTQKYFLCCSGACLKWRSATTSCLDCRFVMSSISSPACRFRLSQFASRSASSCIGMRRRERIAECQTGCRRSRQLSPHTRRSDTFGASLSAFMARRGLRSLLHSGENFHVAISKLRRMQNLQKFAPLFATRSYALYGMVSDGVPHCMRTERSRSYVSPSFNLDLIG